MDEVQNVWESGENGLDSRLWYYCRVMFCGQTKTKSGKFFHDQKPWSSYFDKYLQDFEVPMEGNTCITVSLGWGNEPLDKQVKMFHRSTGGILS